MNMNLLTPKIFDEVVNNSSGYIQEVRQNMLNYTSFYKRSLEYDISSPKTTVRLVNGKVFYSTVRYIALNIPHLLYTNKDKKKMIYASDDGITVAQHAALCDKTIEVEVNRRKIPDGLMKLVVCHNGTTLLFPQYMNDKRTPVFNIGDNDVNITIKDYKGRKYINSLGTLNNALRSFDTGITYDNDQHKAQFLRVYKDGYLLEPCMVDGDDVTHVADEHYFTISDSNTLIYNYDKIILQSTRFEIIDDYTISGINIQHNSDGKIVVPKDIFEMVESPISTKQVKVFCSSDKDSFEYESLCDIDRIAHRVYEIDTQGTNRNFIIRVYDNVVEANKLLQYYDDDIMGYMKFFYDEQLASSIFSPGANDFSMGSIKDYYESLMEDPNDVTDEYDLTMNFDDRVRYIKDLIRTNSNNFKNYLANFSGMSHHIYTEEPELISKLIRNGLLIVSLTDVINKDDDFFVWLNGLKVNRSYCTIEEGIVGHVTLTVDVDSYLNDRKETESDPVETIKYVEIKKVAVDNKIPQVRTVVDDNMIVTFNRVNLGLLESDNYVVYKRTAYPEMDNSFTPSRLVYHHKILVEYDSDFEVLSDDPVTGEIRLKLSNTSGAVVGDKFLIMNTRFSYIYTYNADEAISSDRGVHDLTYYDETRNEIIPIPLDKDFRVDIYCDGQYYINGVDMYTMIQGLPPEKDLSQIQFRRIPPQHSEIEIYISGVPNSTYSAVEFIDGEDNPQAIIRMGDLIIPYDIRYMTAIIDGKRVQRSNILQLTDKTIKILDEELPFLEFGVITEFENYGVTNFAEFVVAYAESDKPLDDALAYHLVKYDYSNMTTVDSGDKRSITEIMDESPLADQYTLYNDYNPNKYDGVVNTISPLVNKYIDDVVVAEAERVIDANRFIHMKLEEYGIYIPENENSLTVIPFDANKVGIVAVAQILDANFRGRTANIIKRDLALKMHKNLLTFWFDEQLKDGSGITQAFDANREMYDIYMKNFLHELFGILEIPPYTGVIDANIEYSEGTAPILDANTIFDFSAMHGI